METRIAQTCCYQLAIFYFAVVCTKNCLLRKLYVVEMVLICLDEKAVCPSEAQNCLKKLFIFLFCLSATHALLSAYTKVNKWQALGAHKNYKGKIPLVRHVLAIDHAVYRIDFFVKRIVHLVNHRAFEYPNRVEVCN
jgi:hypothetical protein